MRYGKANRLNFLLEITAKAGALLWRRFGKIGLDQADHKGGAHINLVSAADAQSQALIVREIKGRYPGELILAEEGDLSRASVSMRRGPLWVIDPLDGTTNFLHGFPLFAVTVAFCQDGKPVLGATYDPSRRELFWAELGHGAFCREQTPTSALAGPHADRRLQVTQTSRLDLSLMVTGMGYDRRERSGYYLRHWKGFLKVAHDIRRTGAAAVDLAWIAAGRADGFWEWGLSPWDVAAGALLVLESGGRITHMDGSPYSIFRSRETLATNGRIHTSCLGILRQ